MRSQYGSAKPGIALRLSTACVLALSVSACSSDAMRFTSNPFDSPFKTAQAPAQRDPVTTGSINSAPMAPGRPIASVRSQPLPPPQMQAQPLPPPQSAVALRSAPPTPVVGSANGWSAQGGTEIVVAQGETLDVISSRYGVPRSALISTNGLSGGALAPGSRLVIPVYNAGGESAPRQQVMRNEAPAAAPQRLVIPTSRPAPAPVAEVKSKAQIAAEAKARAAEAQAQAKAKAAEDQAQAKAKAAADAQAMRESRAKFAAEAKAKAEARKVAAAKPVVETKPVVAETKKPAPAPVPEKAKPAVVASAPPEPKVTAVPKAAPEPAAEPVTTASLPKQEEAPSADFRWPARGRVIAGYSGKGANEGINIAVPEGTPVKAAEGGVVAYAGSELKGYGNLVLIRHPNGYVSAYAHNGELSVKRGETVKRGQVVAKSGQTGNVASPQLHFELRKGSTPVDPVPYLNN